MGLSIGVRRAAVVRFVCGVWLGSAAGALLLASCSSDRSGQPITTTPADSGVFGGSGGQSSVPAAGSRAAGGASPSGGGAAGSPDRCASVPVSAEPRIDNFEDADKVPLSEPGRHGQWQWSAEGDPDAGTQSFVVVEGGANGSDFAAHLTALGFGATGVSLGVSLGTALAGVPCPYNASPYVGIALFVKGTGRIQLKVSTSDIFSTEFGGTCIDSKEQCWDAYQKALPLDPAWTYRQVRWDALAQQGWGKQVPLDPAHFMNLTFEATPDELPADFWIDELRFIKADDMAPPDAGNTGSAGGQAGASAMSEGGSSGGP